jgi:hypothetical protein
MFTATTVFLAVVRNRILPGNELHRRFGIFRQHCAEILSSTNMRNTLVSQLESLLNFLGNALCQNDQDGESFLTRIPDKTWLTKAKPMETLLQAPARVGTSLTSQHNLIPVHTTTRLLQLSCPHTTFGTISTSVRFLTNNFLILCGWRRYKCKNFAECLSIRDDYNEHSTVLPDSFCLPHARLFAAGHARSRRA